jgi:hypothetical protein
MDRIGLWPFLLAGGPPDVLALQRLIALGGADAQDPILRLAALFPAPEIAASLQKQLALSSRDQRRIIAGLAAARDISLRELSLDHVARLVHRHGPASFGDGLLLAAASQGWVSDQHEAFRMLAGPLLADPPAAPFSSGDVAALGIPPGARMGLVLKAATQRWLDDGRPTEPARLSAILEQAMADAAD